MSARPAATTSPVLLFDGHCGLCHRAVRWLLAHDRRGVLRFAPLESDAGRTLLDAHGFAGARPDTVVLLADGRAFLRSDAVLAVVTFLPAPWCWLRWLHPLPRRLRDAVYDLVARRRHRWFGRHETCPLPAPEVRDRFLDGR